MPAIFPKTPKMDRDGARLPPLPVRFGKAECGYDPMWRDREREGWQGLLPAGTRPSGDLT